MKNVVIVDECDLEEARKLAQESDIKFILALTDAIEISKLIEMLDCAMFVKTQDKKSWQLQQQ